MSANIRYLSVLMAALVFQPAGPAAAQTQGDQATVTTPDLSQALDGAWQRLGDGRSEKDEQRSSSLLSDVVGDYGRFFTTRENYLILGLGLTSSLSLKALDEPIRDSRFNSGRFRNSCGQRARSGRGRALPDGSRWRCGTARGCDIRRPAA